MSVALQLSSDDETSEQRPTCAEERAERGRIHLQALLSPPPIRHSLALLVPAVFMANILTFLDARELAVMGACSRYTLEVSRDAFLWSSLYQRDFEFFADGRADEAEAEADLERGSSAPPPAQLRAPVAASWIVWGRSAQPPPPPPSPLPYAPITPSDPEPPTASDNPAPGPPASTSADRPLAPGPGPRALHSRTKAEYLSRFRRTHSLIQAARTDKEARVQALKRENRAAVQASECCLDWTQLRLFTPLQLAAIFASVLLLAACVDGVRLSIWFVALPFMAFFAYLFASVAALVYVYRQQDERRSACVGLWPYVRGPLRSVAALLGHSPRLVVLALLCALLACAQVGGWGGCCSALSLVFA